jgi:SprT protein
MSQIGTLYVNDLQRRLTERMAQCQRLATAVHPDFPEVRCSLFSGRRAAGLAFGNEHRIAINRVLLEENPSAMLRDTVAHEFAHIVVWWRYLRARQGAAGRELTPPKGHGTEWKAVMSGMFGVEPLRCHRFDTSNTGARLQRRWPYRCRCRSHLVTTAKHRRIEAGASYVCSDCDWALQPAATSDAVARTSTLATHGAAAIAACDATSEFR